MGFDWESRCAWRRLPHDKNAVKEFTSDLRPTSSNPEDAAEAWWKDGYNVCMDEITNQDLQEMQSTKKMERVNKFQMRTPAGMGSGKGQVDLQAETSKMRGTIWSGMLQDARLSVVMRVDHTRSDGTKTRIAALFHRGKQCCQVPLSCYEESSHDSLTKVMIQVAEELVAGSTTLEKVKERRDEILKRKGLVRLNPRKTSSGPGRSTAASTTDEGIRTPSPKRKQKVKFQPSFDDPETSMFDF